MRYKIQHRHASQGEISNRLLSVQYLLVDIGVIGLVASTTAMRNNAADSTATPRTRLLSLSSPLLSTLNTLHTPIKSFAEPGLKNLL
jgi:hypothetical protein